MSETERTRKYRYNRVLIETERILTPEFSDAVVYLSGAQIEMLRNVTQYLNRLDTYVTEYNPGYYLTPTAADYDDILEIVADLEETLMGNPNTIWGYTDTVEPYNSWGAVGAGDRTLHVSPVPAGEVWCIQAVYATNDATVTSSTELFAEYPSREVALAELASPAINQRVRWDGSLILNEDCRLGARFYGCGAGDNLAVWARGYIMTVPT